MISNAVLNGTLLRSLGLQTPVGLSHLFFSIWTVGIFRPLQLNFKPLHADLKAVHGLNGRLGARRVVEANETCESDAR